MGSNKRRSRIRIRRRIAWGARGLDQLLHKARIRLLQAVDDESGFRTACLFTPIVGANGDVGPNTR